MACRYHSAKPVAGKCVDCKKDYCEECAVPIVRHGVLCLDCGAAFARKKLIQSYVAAGIGLVFGVVIMGSAFSEGQYAFAVVAPLIYPYFFWGTFFGWHYGGRIWQKLASIPDHFEGVGGLAASILVLSIRIMAAVFLGVFGGGIIQFRRYQDLVRFQASCQQPKAATAI